MNELNNNNTYIHQNGGLLESNYFDYDYIFGMATNTTDKMMRKYNQDLNSLSRLCECYVYHNALFEEKRWKKLLELYHPFFAGYRNPISHICMDSDNCETFFGAIIENISEQILSLADTLMDEEKSEEYLLEQGFYDVY